MVTSPKAVESWGAVTDPRTPNTSAHVLSAVKESRVQSSTGWNNASLTQRRVRATSATVGGCVGSVPLGEEVPQTRGPF